MRSRATRLSATGYNSYRRAVAYLADLLIVGGGGQGGKGEFAAGGGGGAGELIYLTSQAITPGSYAITIGAGGNVNDGTFNNGANGANTLGFGFTARGGGGGASGGSGLARVGNTGGSGGGSTGTTGDNYTALGGASTAVSPGVGFRGGEFRKGVGSGARAGAGGGGAFEVGLDADTTNASSTLWYAGKGGDGLAVPITGVSVRYAAGGGGGTRGILSALNVSPQGGAVGGLGGGGNGNRSGAGTAATGFGCGGGGNGDVARTTPGGAGSAGVVIIAYPDTLPALTIGAGLTFTELATRPGFRVYQITAGSGQITFN